MDEDEATTRPAPVEPGEDARHLDDGLEHLLLELAVAFVNVDASDIDRAIDRTLARVGAFCGVDRAYLFRYDHRRRLAHNTHEWCAPGVTSSLSIEQAIPFEQFPEQLEYHLAGEPLFIEDVSVFPEPLRSRLLVQGIRTLINVPVRQGETTIGFVGFDIVVSERPWSRTDIELLGVLGQLLANLEFRRRHEETRHALEDLSVSNQELERFAGTVSHDLRAPLASARGLLDLLATVDTTDRHDILPRVIATLDRALHLVDEVLTHAVSGRVVGAPEVVCLDRVAADAREPLEIPIAERGAVVRVEPMPEVCGDHGRLVAVMQNLLSNALVHGDQDRAPLIVVAASDRGDGWVEVTVTDNGPGIPPERRRSALESFERGDDAGGRPGVGLGLPICRRIVAAHGGVMELDAAPGGGLVVRFTLPARCREADHDVTDEAGPPAAN